MPQPEGARSAAMLAAAGLHPQRLDWLPDGAAVVSRHARRFAAQIELDGPDGPVAVYVKWFAAPRWRELVVGKGWRNPAAIEAAALRRLAAAGIRCPAVLEVRRTGGLVIPGAARLVLGPVPGVALAESLPADGAERRAVAQAVGQLCAKLRRAGLGYPDLHCGHVLVESTVDGPVVGVVDAARAAPAPDLVETLAALAGSCPPEISHTDRWRVLRGALECGRRDAGAKTVARAVVQRAEVLRERFTRRAVGRVAPEINLDGGRLRADEDALPALLAYAFETCNAFRDPGRGQVVRERDGYQNVRYDLRGQGPTVRWYAKRYYDRPWDQRWRAWLGLAPTGDPALREWEMLRRCRALDIPVPDPVAVGLPGPRGEASFVAVAEVGGARPLDAILQEVPSRNREARDGYARALAAVVRRFHAAGMTHRDLYLNHVLAGITPAGPALTLIDLARVERDAPFARHRLVKDLGALEYSAAPLTTRSERVRWLLRYLEHDRLTADDKALARAAAAKAARIAEHEAKVAAQRAVDAAAGAHA